MFLDTINSQLFSALASKNSKLYGLGLDTLYEKLVIKQLDIDTCTPKEARNAIRLQLVMINQDISWDEEGPEPIADEKDDATRIYNRLRDSGWIKEMDEIGYRRVCFFPQMSARLLSSLKALANSGASATYGATCQGVFNSLTQAHLNPSTQSTLIQHAVESSEYFHTHLRDMAGSCREILVQMNENKTGAGMFQVFFEDFLQGIVLGDYSAVKINSNPNRYRQQTISICTSILMDEDKMQVLAEAEMREVGGRSIDDIKVTIEANVRRVMEIFENIHKLFKRIDDYRRAMTRRTSEALQYSTKAVPEFGLKIDRAIKGLVEAESIESLTIPLTKERYFSANRLYRARVKSEPATASVTAKKEFPIRELALSRAYDEAIGRRQIHTDKILQLVERHFAKNKHLTTSDLTIEGIDDLVAYRYLRDISYLTHDRDSPLGLIANYYKLTPTENMTNNEYFSAPEMRIERVSPLPEKLKSLLTPAQ
jgi:hypothetical protein